MVIFCFFTQIRVLEVKEWTPQEGGDKSEFAFIPLLTDREDSRVVPGGTYRVCVLTLSGCSCSLQEDYEEGQVDIPTDISNVDLWSTSDFDEVEEKHDRDFKAFFGTRFYAGHQLAKASKNKVNTSKFMIWIVWSNYWLWLRGNIFRNTNFVRNLVSHKQYCYWAQWEAKPNEIGKRKNKKVMTIFKNL